MNEIVRFSVHKNTKEKRERRAVRQSALDMVRNVPHDADGVAVVWFRNTAPDLVSAYANFHVRNPADAFRLPDIAKYEIRRQLGG